MKRDPLHVAVLNGIAFNAYRAERERFDPRRVQEAEEARRQRECDRIGAVLAGEALCRRIA